jgi:hypothetical protein
LLSITSVKFSDKEVTVREEVSLPYDIYKLKIEFSGLTFREPERVKYQYKLEGHDVDWSEPSSSGYAMYNRIADGEYTFLVRSCNSDGVCSPEPSRFRFTVSSPIWEQWWFILLGTCTTGYILFIIASARGRL